MLLHDVAALGHAGVPQGIAPPLYGIWHPYKYCVEMLHPRFLPLFVYMQQGTVAADTQVTRHPKLRWMELWVGALLCVASADKEAVRRLALRLRQQRPAVKAHLDGLLQRWAAAQFRSVLPHAEEMAVAVLATNVEIADFTTQVDHVLQWARLRMDARRRLQCTIRRAHQACKLLCIEEDSVRGLDMLLRVYAPAMLVLGSLVRDCK